MEEIIRGDKITKICLKCNIEKELEEFCENKECKSGRENCCKDCKILYKKQWREKNKERLSLKNKKRYEKNKEEIKKTNLKNYYENQSARKISRRIYREKNREILLKKKREYRLKNEKKIKEKAKKCWWENREKKLEQHREWVGQNKEYILKYQSEWGKKKRASDPCYCLRKAISCSVWRALKKCFSSKGENSVLDFLPYTVEKLKDHLEKQFEPWMGWRNYGVWKHGEERKWHIEHIYPQSLLPYDSMEHPNFQKVWALENLRPLEAIENIKKSNKVLADKTPEDLTNEL
ncbi:MAG: hypothetical protein H7831_12415 [Magnetococcus sp. WYHC-3]